MVDYFECPHCGADVPRGATACPVCGSDEETGWSEYAEVQDLLLYTPDDERDRYPYGGYHEPSLRTRLAAVPWGRVATGVIALLIIASLLALLGPWGLYAMPVVLLAIAAAFYVAYIRPRMAGPREKELYQELLLRARGDKALVERWVEYERGRNPAAGRLELLEDALYRWQRDNR
jgi:hypothetical protein